MNTLEETEDHPSLPMVRSLVCTILGLTFALGVPGNSFVIWTICKRMKNRPLTIVLILHLAIADILVLVTLPVWIYSFANTWLFDLVTCKALVFIIYCSMYASLFLITALSLERFVAVFYPLVVQQWKNKVVTQVAVSLIWVLSIVLGATIIPFQDMDDTELGLQCTTSSYSSNGQKVACLLAETLLGFVVPFTVISICYVCVGKRISRLTCPAKRRSARLITSVVVAFAVCWLPHHIFNLLSVVSALTEESHQETFQSLEDISNVGVYIAGSVTFISSCINPLLYAFAARNFQSSVRLAKMSKLFEQMTPAVTQEDVKERTEETLTSSELV